jgi:uncharacterized protein
MMNQTVLLKGKNVLEAIELGLILLGTKKEEVSIEVIQRENKGFFKIGSKEAVVKLTKIFDKQNVVEQTSPQIPILSQENFIDPLEIRTRNGHNQLNLEVTKKEDELSGKVWVKNGQIYSKPSPLHYPTISIEKGIKLFKNNQLVTGTVVVSTEDHFTIQTEIETKEPKWNISIDSNKLNVLLYVETGMRKTYKLKDIKPDFHIKLEAEEIIEFNSGLKYKQILKLLKDLKVTHGFNYTEIMRAVNTGKDDQFIIASGIAPKDGENGRIELVFDRDKKKRNAGSFHSREYKMVPTVEKGQVIAHIHPPVPGKMGYTVTNEPIQPKPTYPIIVKTGKGISLIENDTKIVAIESGRPVIEQKELMVNFSISEKLIHSGDLSISSGNIYFQGDVDIEGNVEEGMAVEADGNIAILKNVYSASISSNSSVSIDGQSIASTISAGKQEIFSSEMGHLLTNIKEEKENLLLAIQQLMKIPAFKMSDYSRKGLLPLIKLLLERRFKTLLNDVKQFNELSKKWSHILDREWLDVAEQLRLCFLASFVNEYHTLEKMNGILQNIEELIERNQIGNEKQKCSVTLMYALNSSIYSAGDVVIKEQGCNHTKIHAGGNVTIHGVFGSGELYAREGACIKETGSEDGAKSKIMVSNKGTIKIELAKKGTIIQIGKEHHTFQSDERGIMAKLNENGKIEVLVLSGEMS